MLPLPLTGQFLNLLLEGLDRLWKIHGVLPNPRSIIYNARKLTEQVPQQPRRISYKQDDAPL